MASRNQDKGKPLPQSEDRFRLLFDSAADALFLHDLEGRFVEVNQTACSSLGYTREELLQLPFSSIVKGGGPEALRAMWDRVVKGEKLTLQGFHQRKDGTEFPVEVHLGPFEYAGRPHILASARDISDRQRAEEARRTSESFLNSIIDQSPYPMWISDAQGLLIRLNQACQDLLQITAAEVVGKYNVFKDNIVEQQGFIPLLQRVFEKGETVRFEITYDTSLLRNLPLRTAKTVILDVTVSPIIDTNGKITNAVFQHVDVTDRKRAEAALELSEKKYRSFYQSMLEGFVSVDLAGHILETNQSYLEMIGYTAEEIQGMRFQDITPARWHKSEAEIIEQQVLTRGYSDTYEKEYIHKDGTVFPVELRAYLIKDRTGVAADMWAFVRDITERKRAEEALKKEKLFTEAILDSLPGTFFLLDSQGKHLRTNTSGLITSGYTLEEMSHMHALDFIAEEDKPAAQRALEEVFEKGEASVEVQQLAKDGRKIPFLFSAKKFTIDGLPYILGTGVDITELKQTEEALRESEKKYRSLYQEFQGILDAIPDNLSLLSPDLKIVWANELAAADLNMEMSGFIGQFCYQARHGRSTPCDGCTVLKCFASGKPTSGESITPDGGIWELRALPLFGEQGEVAGVIEVARNISDRKRMEEALRQSESRFRQVVESSPLPLGIGNDAGMIEYVNPKFVETFGYTLEDLPRIDDWFRLAYPDPAYRQGLISRWQKSLENLIRGKSASEGIEVEVTCKDGSKRIMQIFASLMGNNALVIFNDLTERKRAEEALRDSERRLSELIDFLPDATFAIDRAGKVIAWNRAIEEMTGVKAESIIGQGDYAYALPFYGIRRPILIDLVFMSDEEIEKKYIFVQRQGEILLAEADVPLKGKMHLLWGKARPLYDRAGNIVGAIEAIRDITERQQAQEALQESEKRLREAQEMAHLGFWYWNVETGDVTWSEEVYNIFQLDPKEFTPHIDSILKLSPWPEDHARDQELIRKAMESHEKGAFEQRFLLPDKSIGYYYSTFQGKYDDAGNLLFIVGTVLDITARKRAEEERAKLEAQMREVQKLESLGVLAGGIAHDFNNLLMSILGNADLALLGLSPASPARPNLEEIVRASQRAADLCRQMLAYSGKGRFVVGRYDLSEIVREMAQMLRVTVSKKAALRYSFAADLPPVEVDATQMRQVIMNLLTNASEALGDASGAISISTGIMYCDRAFFSESHLDDHLPEGNYVFLEVADTGCGLDEETRRRIFDPFFTTKFTGRGLGLAAVLGIVRGHQGAIKVASEPGKGTTFTILLPAAAWQPGDRVLTTKLAAAPRRQGTILLIDDDPHVLRVSGEMLGRLGLQVLTASHGQEGLEVFRAKGEEIDCVILDLTMPGMGGEDAFQEMRRLRPEVRVVLSSGYDEQDAMEQFTGQGLAGFIQKPYTVAKLQEVLNRVLGQ